MRQKSYSKGRVKLNDKKLIAAALLLPVTLIFAGAVLATGNQPPEGVNNAAPSVQPIETETYVNIPIEVELSATDSENDVVLYQLTEQPRLGSASISDGVLHYAPGQRTGKDKFAYTAVDAAGNTAAPAPITIRVEKNKAKRTYVDMDGNPAHYAALRLSAEGIMTGETIGGCAFFRPAQEVTRSEFIAMVAAAAELPIEPTRKTDFADDSGLSSWAKPFVSTAAANGLINGYQTSSGASEIRGQNFITIGEASVIVNNLLASKLDDMQYTLAQETDGSPEWAQDAMGSLERINVISARTAVLDENAVLNRQTACEILYRAVRLARS